MGRKEQFEELLKELKLSDEDKGTLRTMAEKEPGLAEAMLRQADYDRSMNENKDKLAKADEWVQWADRNVPKFNQMSTEYDGVVKERDELKAKIASGEVNDVQAQELQTRILKEVEGRLAKAGGAVDDAALNKMISESVTKVVGETATNLETKFTKETLPANMNFMRSVLRAEGKFFREFGEDIDDQAFMKHIATSGKETVDEAYDTFVATKRLEKKHADELQKAKDEAAAAERARLANQNFPGSTAVVVPAEGGPVQQFIKAAAPAPAKPADGGTPQPGLGDGSLAALAAAELRAEGKF